MLYIIEHLEPRLYKWCQIEYRHISEIVGKKNLIFTNIKSDKAKEKLKNLGKTFRESITELDFGRPCILDPESDKILSPKDAKNFDCMIFGGILGDHPPKKRTKDELTDIMKKKGMKFEIRNIGDKQMPTNIAVYTAKKIIDGTPFKDLRFADELEIVIEEGESVILPFRFIIDNEKPVLAKDFIEFIVNRKGF